MIRIINVLDEIATVCFTEEEKKILEFEINGRKMTIERQFKQYYRGACYTHDKDDLFDEIILVKEQNLELLEQIKKCRYMAEIATNPYSYNTRKSSITDKEEGRGSASSHDNTMIDESRNKQDTVANEYEQNKRLSQSRAAKSETNEVHDLSEVWQNFELNQPTYQKKDIIEGGDYASSSVTHSDVAASSTTLEQEQLTPLEYQNFNTEESLDGDYSNNHTNNTTANKSYSKQKSDGTNTNISHTSTAKRVTSDEYVLGDAIVKTAQLQLPKFRDKFWSKFADIFHYERDY